MGDIIQRKLGLMREKTPTILLDIGIYHYHPLSMLMFISTLVEIFQSKHDLGYTLCTNEQVVVPDDSPVHRFHISLFLTCSNSDQNANAIV